MAYGAALDLATAVVLASGHRVKARAGHHELTFEAAGVALGKQSEEWIAYFDLARRRRNVISSDGDEVGEAAAAELLRETLGFASLVDLWLVEAHPELVPEVD